MGRASRRKRETTRDERVQRPEIVNPPPPRPVKAPGPDPERRCPCCGCTRFRIHYEVGAAVTVDAAEAVVLQVNVTNDGAPRDFDGEVWCDACDCEYPFDANDTIVEVGLISDLADWEEGIFTFEEDTLPPVARIECRPWEQEPMPAEVVPVPTIDDDSVPQKIELHPGLQRQAMFLAKFVRDALEKIHGGGNDLGDEGLTDVQMRAINPLVRNAIATGLLVGFKAQEEGDVQAHQLMNLTLAFIPDYWEPPELLEEYASLR